MISIWGVSLLFFSCSILHGRSSTWLQWWFSSCLMLVVIVGVTWQEISGWGEGGSYIRGTRAGWKTQWECDGTGNASPARSSGNDNVSFCAALCSWSLQVKIYYSNFPLRIMNVWPLIRSTAKQTYRLSPPRNLSGWNLFRSILVRMSSNSPVKVVSLVLVLSFA